MIRIVLGNVGSGKTAMIVREMYLSKKPIHSNIITKKIKNNTQLKREHIIQKELVKTKRDGTPVYKKNLNIGYWKNLNKKKSISVVLDEAHTLMNPRRSMSETSKVMLDFLALLRRVLGSSDEGYGELVLITQLERRLDVVAKEMATKVQYCICHYLKQCKRCNLSFPENNETPEKLQKCPMCNHNHLKRVNFQIEVYNFINMDSYNLWKLCGMKTYYDKYYITDIQNYFGFYDTLQWDNLLTEE